MKKNISPVTHTPTAATSRPPVVAIMGHIDHGKSTLLDYIRKSNITAQEAGGITQHLGAYEITHQGSDGTARRITFLDTPGHAAFGGIRERSAKVADIAILVVSGEEGVKPQTVEAYKHIQATELPFIVAITKSDSPKTNIERVRQSLAEHEIFVEGYGGGVSSLPVSGKTGDGIPELLELILLAADMAEITYNPHAAAQGVVIEAKREEKRGNAATIVIKDGTLETGVWLSCGEATTPVRFIENDRGEQVKSATASQPVRVIGWSMLPPVGTPVFMHPDRKTAEAAATLNKQPVTPPKTITSGTDEGVPSHRLELIIKADTASSVEAIVNETRKLTTPAVTVMIASASVGDITENDIKLAQTRGDCTIICFNVSIKRTLIEMAERQHTPILSFDIIYKLIEAIEVLVKDRTPKTATTTTDARLKVLKVFSVEKDKQIIGGRVEEGTLIAGAPITIIRRNAPLGPGKVRGLEHNRQKTTEVTTGMECGAMIESKILIAPGDILEATTTQLV